MNNDQNTPETILDDDLDDVQGASLKRAPGQGVASSGSAETDSLHKRKSASGIILYEETETI